MAKVPDEKYDTKQKDLMSLYKHLLSNSSRQVTIGDVIGEHNSNIENRSYSNIDIEVNSNNCIDKRSSRKPKHNEIRSKTMERSPRNDESHYNKNYIEIAFGLNSKISN